MHGKALGDAFNFRGGRAFDPCRDFIRGGLAAK